MAQRKRARGQDTARETVAYEEYQEVLNELQEVKKQLKEEKKKVQELSRKNPARHSSGVYVVLQFENGGIYGKNEYSTEEKAVAKFSKLLQEYDLGEEPPELDCGKSHVYVKENQDCDKVFSFLLCGVSQETARKQMEELKSKYNQDDEEDDDNDNDDDDDDEEDDDDDDD